jgi:uncharacterized protein (DUF2141 family)
MATRVSLVILPLLATTLLRLSAFAQSPVQQALTVTVEYEGSAKGAIRIAFWNDAASFLTGRPYRTATASLSDGKATVVFGDIGPGEYAVSAFLDKNGNGKLDRNFIGKPSEPYGFSHGARGRLGPPRFSDARVAIAESKRTIFIHLE